jgi:site-specific recombinase XerD
MEHIESRTLEKLSKELLKYLNSLSYSGATIKRYETDITKISVFMREKNYKYYSSEICEGYIKSIIGNGTYQSLKRNKKNKIRCANALLEYQLTGSIPYRCVKKTYNFSGEPGNHIKRYIKYRLSQNISEKTIASDRIYLNRLNDYLRAHNISKIDEIKKDNILEFIHTLSFFNHATIHCTLSTLKGFVKHLHANNYIPLDLSYVIPKDNYKDNSKLPSTYSPDEIAKLLAAVDRGSPKGKRDYAIILLAAKLGLRASDICNLQFENILWDKDSIVLIQEKTGKEIELPLLEEIGNAIIDYLRFARPKSKFPHIFIHLIPPFQKLKSPTLHSIISFYMRRARICYKGKRHGPHALRHSLAGLLLEKMTPLPVISEVLGHKNTESTKDYLRIDLSSLKNCALNVPPLNTDFYNNKEVR